MTREVNFDGLVGPTHNYGGLSIGNLASMNNQGEVSNPKGAALQGLQKMRKLMSLGLTQGFLLPHERPHVKTLRSFGMLCFGSSLGVWLVQDSGIFLHHPSLWFPQDLQHNIILRTF